MVGGADDYVGAKSIYFIRCVNSGVARQKIMADRCARRFGSGLKQSCKLMQQPWANERPVAPSLLITTNLITVTRSRLIVPPVLEKRDASRQIARSNPPPPPPFLARSTIDRYFLLPFHPESNGINIAFNVRSILFFDSASSFRTMEHEFVHDDIFLPFDWKKEKMGFQASPIFKLRVKLRAISDPLEDVSVSKNEIIFSFV